jgi:serine O-acetyltransferase
VPPNSVVVGVPGQVVARSQPRDENIPDLEHNRLPDAIGETLVTLMQRVEELEERLNGHFINGKGPGKVDHPQHMHVPEGGVWRGEDFSI